MKIKNKQNNAFNESFLWNSLNAFEGDSNYFKTLNAHFAAFLLTYFKDYDIDKSRALLLHIKSEKAYKAHPFFPFFLKFLTEGKISKREQIQLNDALIKHPKYPLALYLKEVLAQNNQNEANDYLLLIIKYLKNPTENITNLTRLSEEGFAFATFKLMLKKLKNHESSSLEPLLLLTVNQNGGNTQETSVIYLEKLLKSSTFNVKVQEDIFRLLVKNGAMNYLLPLVEIYEKAGDFTSAFFALHRAHALKIKEATTRLRTYYKNGKNLPSAREIIKYLEDKID